MASRYRLSPDDQLLMAACTGIVQRYGLDGLRRRIDFLYEMLRRRGRIDPPRRTRPGRPPSSRSRA